MHNTEIFHRFSWGNLFNYVFFSEHWISLQLKLLAIGQNFFQDQRHALKTGHKIIETRFSKFLYIKVRIMVLMLSVNKPFISMGVFYSSSMAVNNSCLYCVYHKSNVFHFSCYIYCVKSLQKKRDFIFLSLRSVHTFQKITMKNSLFFLFVW